MEDLTDIADRLHSAAIHLLRVLRREDPGMLLAPARASALSVIVYAGPMTLGALADSERVRSPTMSRIVDQLVSEQLATKSRSSQDGRSILIEATDAGRRRIVEGRQERVAALARRLETLPADDLATLRRAAELLAEVSGVAHHP